MKKFILTTLLILTSLLGFSQYDISDTLQKEKKEHPLLASVNTTLRYGLNMPRLQTYYQPTTYVGVDLRLSNSKGNYNYTDQDTRRNTFLGIFVAGIAFTSASILESGDFKIYQGETARQIMLGVGIAFTLTGGIGAISCK